MSFVKNSLIIKRSGESIDIVKNRWIEGSGLIALATHKKLWDTINAEYDANERRAIEAYANSSLYDLPVLKTLTVPVRAMTIKIYSLYALHEQDGNEVEWLNELTNKGYKRFVDYIRNQRTFEWGDFFDFVLKQNPEMSSAEQHHIALLMIVVFDHVLLPTFQTPAGNTMAHNVVQNNSVMGAKDKYLEELKEQNKLKALRKLNDTIHAKIPLEQNIDWFFQEHEGYLITNELSSSEKKQIIQKGDYDPLYKRGLLRYYKPLTGILREHQMNDFNYSGLSTITRDEFLSIYVLFEQAVEKERLLESEWELFLTSSILLTMMINHYQELSDFYFDAVKKQEELVLKQKTLSVEQKNWLEEKEDYLKKEKELEKKLGEKDAYILELEERLKEVEKNQEENTSLRKEVAALRSYAYHQRAELPEASTNVNAVDLATTLLKEKKSVLFGGHPQLVNKLKDALPSIEYRDVDSINRDISFIRNQDIVFLMTNYFNHPFYYKLMNELEKHPHVRLIYLSGYPNLDRTLNEMADLLKS